MRREVERDILDGRGDSKASDVGFVFCEYDKLAEGDDVRIV